jgi:signal transduction histidine kinase
VSAAPAGWRGIPRRQTLLAGRLLAMVSMLAVVYALDRWVLNSPTVTWVAYALPVLIAPRLVPPRATPLVLVAAILLGWWDTASLGSTGWDDVLRTVLLLVVGLYALRDAQRECELEAAKERLLRLVSHELRTPLHHIKGFASTLLQPDLEWDAASQRECLEAIEQSSDRLTRLIEALLDMARIADGRRPLQQQPCQPTTLVAASVEQTRYALGLHPVRVDGLADLPAVWADSVQIERVLANLLDNAAKYSPAGSPIQVQAATAGDRIVIRVIDQGRGVQPAEQQRIFERFQRGSAAIPSRAPGVGLGLSLAREIVAAHGGRLWVQPNRPCGSMFAFSLPICRPERRHAFWPSRLPRGAESTPGDVHAWQDADPRRRRRATNHALPEYESQGAGL